MKRATDSARAFQLSVSPDTCLQPLSLSQFFESDSQIKFVGRRCGLVRPGRAREVRAASAGTCGHDSFFSRDARSDARPLFSRRIQLLISVVRRKENPKDPKRQKKGSRARHTATSRLYAIKIISLECLTLEKQIERCQAERDVLSNVAHDRIIKLHFASHTHAGVSIFKNRARVGNASRFAEALALSLARSLSLALPLESAHCSHRRYRLPQHVALASGPARRLSLSRGLRAARLSQKTTKTARHSISQVFEYCAGGELFHHLCKKRALAPEVVAFYTAEREVCAPFPPSSEREREREKDLRGARARPRVLAISLATRRRSLEREGRVCLSSLQRRTDLFFLFLSLSREGPSRLRGDASRDPPSFLSSREKERDTRVRDGTSLSPG